MVRILVASRRPWAAEALATSSYGTNFDQPWSADTLVSAAVSVVLPWSTWPMVPTLTCGFFRSNFSLAMVLLLAGYDEVVGVASRKGRAFYAKPLDFAMSCSPMC